MSDFIVMGKLKSMNEIELPSFTRKYGHWKVLVYYCPHHPEISGPCTYRKPNPGMIFEVAEKFNLDLGQSILIGDKISDIIAGENAGLGLNILIHPNFIPLKLF